MTKKDITTMSYRIVGCAIKVHKSLGPGLLESVNQKCLVFELIRSGFKVNQHISVPIEYDSVFIECDLRLDILVDDLVVVELKTVENLLPVHKAQLLTYMKLLKMPQGLLINFYTDNISKSTIPFVNEYFNLLPG